MIKVNGSDIASITNGLTAMLHDDDLKLTMKEFTLIVQANELLNIMYYHRHDMIKKDV